MQLNNKNKNVQPFGGCSTYMYNRICMITNKKNRLCYLPKQDKPLPY